MGGEGADAPWQHGWTAQQHADKKPSPGMQLQHDDAPGTSLASSTTIPSITKARIGQQYAHSINPAHHVHPSAVPGNDGPPVLLLTTPSWHGRQNVPHRQSRRISLEPLPDHQSHALDHAEYCEASSWADGTQHPICSGPEEEAGVVSGAQKKGGRRGGGGGAGRGALPEVVHIRVLMVAAIASLTPGSFRCI